MKLSCLAGIVLIGQLCASAADAAVCVSPPSFGDDIPDGASASRADMLSAQRTLKAYDNAVIAYTACLRDSGQSVHGADVADQALRLLASRFNEQLIIFKKRSGAE